MIDSTTETLAWYEGKILPLSEIRIPATDSALEHGVGLFESMRASRGRVPLWNLHQERLTRSAAELGLRFDASNLITEKDLHFLLKESGLQGQESRLRLTFTGGSPGGPGRLWVAAYPLGSSKIDNLILHNDFWSVDDRDRLNSYKSLNYWLRRHAFEAAQADGADESLSIDTRGRVWEGSRTSLFLVKHGRLIAPELNGPRLSSVSEKALTLILQTHGSLQIQYAEISENDLATADELILTNAVRGLMTVGRWRDHSYPIPGEVATQLRKIWHEHYF